METKHHNKLSAKERDLIAVWRGGGFKIREIGRRLKRSPGTISDEIKRNSFGGHYVAIHAQAVSQERKRQAGERQPLKNPQTYSYVMDKLQQGWSPEQIAGRLELEQEEKIIHHETIYRFVYARGTKHLKLWEYLPRNQTRRRKQHGRTVHKSHIPQRVSIHQRPEAVNTRSVFGHWEGDTVEGKGHKDGIHTEAERLTRKLAARIVAAITSEAAIYAQEAIFSNLPQRARKSTTLDNGRENHLHMRLKKLKKKTYFADPYSSWQRGTNEYHNGLLRRYLPKGTSFANLSQEELDDIVWEINNRPRKVLNFYTAEEIFNLNLGVRIPDRM